MSRSIAPLLSVTTICLCLTQSALLYGDSVTPENRVLHVKLEFTSFGPESHEDRGDFTGPVKVLQRHVLAGFALVTAGVPVMKSSYSGHVTGTRIERW